MTLEEYKLDIEKQIEVALEHASVYKGCTDGSYQAVLCNHGYGQLKEIQERLEDGDDIDYIIHMSGEEGDD